MAGRRQDKRDTAKDIILGTDPSGNGPRNPREGRLLNNQRGQGGPPPPPQRPPPQQNVRNNPPPPPPPQINGGGGNNQALMQEIMRLQASMRQFQRQTEDGLNQESDARRRLEAQLRSNQDNLGRINERVRGAEGNSGNVKQHDLEEAKRARAQLDSNVLRMGQDIQHLKGQIDRQQSDIMALNNEIKSRPVIDPSKMNNTQHLDGRMRDLHGQIMSLKSVIDGEVNDRRRVDQEQALNMQQLQAQLSAGDSEKNSILQQLAMKGDHSNKALSEEAKRLNDKIQLITDEVTRNMQSKEQAIRDENNQKYIALEKAIKAELEARLTYEREIRTYLEGKWKTYSDDLEDIREGQAGDKGKIKEKMLKMNESIAVLERHLEQGNKKMDRVVAAEIQSRKLHEKGLLQKLTDIEDRLAGHLGSLNRAIDDTRKGKDTDKVSQLDTDAMRRDMEAIAADKQKMSMEGLLKLEEKMQRIERGLDRDSKELKDKFETTSVVSTGSSGGDSDSTARIRHQLRKLDDTQEEIERAHERLNELSMKLDNAKKQMNDRMDREEQERYTGIKELQDEISKLKNRPNRGVGDNNGSNKGAPAANPQLERDVEECKIGIKKLAEAVTTVKNVLDRRINEEARQREKDLSKLDSAVTAFKGKK